MSGLKRILKSILKLGLADRQHQFYKWKLDNSKEIKITKYSKIPGLAKKLDKMISPDEIIQKQCFSNAFDVASSVSGVSYVEGEILTHGVPIEHAWNKFGKYYFDLTDEFALDGKLNATEYLGYIELSSKSIWKYASKMMYKGPFAIEVYKHDVLKEYESPSYEEFLYERKNFYTDTSYIEKELAKVKPMIIGNDLGNLEIENILNKAFYSHHLSFENGWGESAFDSMRRVAISSAATDNSGEMIIYYEDHFYEVFQDDEYWNEFTSIIKRTVRHESVHRKQMIRMAQNKTDYEFQLLLQRTGTDPANQYDYLSSKYETQAFAVEAVEELRSIGYTDEQILQKIKSRKDLEESDIIFLYMEMFDQPDSLYNKNDKRDVKEMKQNKAVLNKFFKEMFTYIKNN